MHMILMTEMAHSQHAFAALNEGNCHCHNYYQYYYRSTAAGSIAMSHSAPQVIVTLKLIQIMQKMPMASCFRKEKSTRKVVLCDIYKFE